MQTIPTALGCACTASCFYQTCKPNPANLIYNIEKRFRISNNEAYSKMHQRGARGLQQNLCYTNRHHTAHECKYVHFFPKQLPFHRKI